MLERARVGEVEDQLMTGPHRIVVRIDQAPIGMGTKELRVRADHLRFDPQAELHPEASHMGDERVEAGGPLRRIDDPVAERPPVVVAAENQPSSSTKRSTPTAAARSASAERVLRS